MTTDSLEAEMAPMIESWGTQQTRSIGRGDVSKCYEEGPFGQI